MPVKIKQEVVNLENIDSAHTFRLESVTSLGNHDVVPLRKYCFILEKNANYRTGDFGLHLSERVWKIKAPLINNEFPGRYLVRNVVREVIQAAPYFKVLFCSEIKVQK